MDFQLPNANRSEFIRALRMLRAADGIPVHLRDNIRSLTDDEIAVLRSQGNACRDWSLVQVAHDFDPGFVFASVFTGRCILGRFQADEQGYGQGIYGSSLHNVAVGSGSRIHHCPAVSDTVIDIGATLVGSRLSGPQEAARSFGNGQSIGAGIEPGGRDIEIFADLDMDLAERVLGRSIPDSPPVDMASYRRFAADYKREADIPWSYVGPQVRVEGAAVVGSWLGPGARIVDGAQVHGSCILSSLSEPTLVESGAWIHGSIIQWHGHLQSSARIENSLIMEGGHCEHAAKVVSSVVGPNCALGSGETVASFVGPFATAHHQSLVIAAYWPRGRGNIGYGANVGSNHTSRAADQEVWPGEGMFFGLDSAIKLPSDFSRAAYSCVASGVVTTPQRMAFPFSLIADLPNDAPREQFPGGTNILVPGWMLRSNLYAVMRYEYKFQSRNKARRNSVHTDVFSSDVLAMIRDAIEALERTPHEGKDPGHWYQPGEIDGMGSNALRETDRVSALTAYRRALRFGELRGLETPTAEQAQELAELWVWIADGVRSSRERDTRRGAAIIPDYQTTHGPVADDTLVQEMDRCAEAARVQAGEIR